MEKLRPFLVFRSSKVLESVIIEKVAMIIFFFLLGNSQFIWYYANIVQSQVQVCKLDEEFSPPSNLHWPEKENFESICDAWIDEEQITGFLSYCEFPFYSAVYDF